MKLPLILILAVTLLLVACGPNQLTTKELLQAIDECYSIGGKPQPIVDKDDHYIVYGVNCDYRRG